jgi:hypothetical protein
VRNLYAMVAVLHTTDKRVTDLGLRVSSSCIVILKDIGGCRVHSS